MNCIPCAASGPQHLPISSNNLLLKITSRLKTRNARTPRRIQHRTPIHAQSQPPSESAQGTVSPPPPKKLSAADQRTAALAALLRSSAVPDAALAKQLGLTEDYLQTLMELPGTTNMAELKTRLLALSQWQSSLRRGVLPSPSSVDWPAEPFRSKFIDVLKKLEMPRFTRRYPKLLNSLLRQFLEMAKEFEGDLLDEQAKQQKQQQKQPDKSQSQPPPQSSGSGGDQDSEQEQQEGSSQSGSNGDDQDDPSASTEKADERGEASGEDGGEKGDIQMQLEDVKGDQSDPSQNSNANDDDDDNLPEQDGTQDSSAAGFAEKLAEEMLKKFEDDWSPAMEALESAAQAFDDLDGLMAGPEGFDSAKSVWHQSGWRELTSLRKRLEELRELRELVRALGRGGGKGPLKKAPQQVFKTGSPPGVVRTEQSPEETRGLTRSGDLSRMLPMEAHLLAAGWPRKGLQKVVGDDNNDDIEEEEGEGSRACRMLFMARRAERQLMSYERTGWAENEPSRVTGCMEMRPAAELGPIIVCLDTSGSMHGAREVVAKALTLECMRGAHRQGRKCYVYAFSGPGDVMELELGRDTASLSRLLSFLTMSFSGGTDVDAPLALSLERLTREEWDLADILMVTDGEIPSPNEDILRKLKVAREGLGLEVHGLLVGKNVTEPMKELCTHLHVFKSWSAVGGQPNY